MEELDYEETIDDWEPPKIDELKEHRLFKIRNIIQRFLSEREREAVLRREKGETLQVVADRWGVTKERVRQIEKRAIARLRKFLAAA